MWSVPDLKIQPKVIGFGGNSPKSMFFTVAEFCPRLHILYAVCITVLRACHFLSE